MHTDKNEGALRFAGIVQTRLIKIAALVHSNVTLFHRACAETRFFVNSIRNMFTKYDG